LRHFFYFVRPALFYILLFAAYRQAFLLLYVSRVVEVSNSEQHLAFLYGLRLDLAVTSYILFFPFLLWMFCHERVEILFDKILRIYHAMVIAVIHLVYVSSLVIYNFWDTLINWRAVSYLDNPKEAAASVSSIQVLLVTLLIAGLIWVSVLVFRKFFYRPLRALRVILPRIFLTLIFAALLVLAARGGWQLLPINESVAYYSTARQLNDAAVNTFGTWGIVPGWRPARRILFIHGQPQATEVVDSLFASRPPASPDTGIQVQDTVC
jgi:hypothetical protein